MNKKQLKKIKKIIINKIIPIIVCLSLIILLANLLESRFNKLVDKRIRLALKKEFCLLK